VAPAILAGFALYLFLFHRPAFRRAWPALAIMAGVTALLALPLAAAIARTPGAEARLAVVGQPLLDLLRGDPAYALRNTLATLGMFAFSGDPEFLYNLPGRPVFGWGGAALFAAGVALAAWRWRRPPEAFALLWLLGGLAPAFLSTPAASLGHTIAAQPVTYLFPALALAAVARGPNRPVREPRPMRPPLAAALGLAYLALLAARDLPDYFGRWPADPEVRRLYRADLHAAAPALRRLPPGSDLALASPALHPADALALQLDTPGLHLRPRAFTPAWAWPFPDRDVPVLLRAEAGPTRFGPTPAPGGFWLGSTRLAAPESGPESALSAPFANGWTCLGYSLRAGRPNTITLHTYWRVEEHYAPPAARPVEALSGTPLPLKFFAHALDAAGALRAAADRLDVDPATLRSGDTFIQVFEWTADGWPAGAVSFQVGVYDPATGVRVPLMTGGDALHLATLDWP
jgi:hypothetical protein